MSLVCSECRAENEADDAFCSKCGARLEQAAAPVGSGGQSAAATTTHAVGAAVEHSKPKMSLALGRLSGAAQDASDLPRKSPRPGEAPRARGVARVRGGAPTWADRQEVLDARRDVLHADSFAGWVLVGYQTDNTTLELQACGAGGVEEFLGYLEPTQQQYVLLRIPDADKDVKNLAGRPTTRDVLITWTGPQVPIIQRGRFKEHENLVRELLRPVHAELFATGKANFTEAVIRERSHPLSGSHEIN